jgi:hypothetical protein
VARAGRTQVAHAQAIATDLGLGTAEVVCTRVVEAVVAATSCTAADLGGRTVELVAGVVEALPLLAALALAACGLAAVDALAVATRELAVLTRRTLDAVAAWHAQGIAGAAVALLAGGAAPVFAELARVFASVDQQARVVVVVDRPVAIAAAAFAASATARIAAGGARAETHQAQRQERAQPTASIEPMHRIDGLAFRAGDATRS